MGASCEREAPAAAAAAAPPPTPAPTCVLRQHPCRRRLVGVSGQQVGHGREGGAAAAGDVGAQAAQQAAAVGRQAAAGVGHLSRAGSQQQRVQHGALRVGLLRNTGGDVQRKAAWVRSAAAWSISTPRAPAPALLACQAARVMVAACASTTAAPKRSEPPSNSATSGWLPHASCVRRGQGQRATRAQGASACRSARQLGSPQQPPRTAIAPSRTVPGV